MGVAVFQGYLKYIPVLKLSSLHNRPLPKFDLEIKYNKQKEILLQL